MAVAVAPTIAVGVDGSEALGAELVVELDAGIHSRLDLVGFTTYNRESRMKAKERRIEMTRQQAESGIYDEKRFLFLLNRRRAMTINEPAKGCVSRNVVFGDEMYLLVCRDSHVDPMHFILACHHG
eukprot:9479231-Pyramimonas_sp.AAC.2